MSPSDLLDGIPGQQSLVSDVGGHDGGIQYVYPRQKRWCVPGHW